MVRIPVYEYACTTSRGIVRVPTFKPGKGATLGAIVAPEGSTLDDRGMGVLKLKVPKPGRVAESYLFVADDAVKAARAGADGLRWEPAAAAAAGTVAHA
jgi:hypothetical protein